MLRTAYNFCILCGLPGLALLTELMYSRKFTVNHARVAYMKIFHAEGQTIPPWDIMNVSMTLQSLNCLTTTSYQLVETEFSRFGNKLASSFQKLLYSVSVASYLAIVGPGAMTRSRAQDQKHKKMIDEEMEDFPPYPSLPRKIFV